MPNKLTPQTSISSLFMIGPIYAKRLKKLGIETVEDFLHHYPFRYDDFSLIKKVGECQADEIVTLCVTIVSLKNIYTRTGKQLQKALVADETGRVEVTWFNQSFLAQTLKPSMKIALAGKINIFGFKKTMLSPEYEIIKQQAISYKSQEKRGGENLPLAACRLPLTTIHTGRLVPIYPETYGVSSKWLRSRIAPLIKNLVPRMPDWLPQTVQKRFALCSLNFALANIHFPTNKKTKALAQRRLSFDELVLLQLKTLVRKCEWQSYKTTTPLVFNQKKIEKFIKSLPFKLTFPQQKSVSEILKDLKKEKPMNRLLEGDVGSGKTIVAAIAAYATNLSGATTIIMAPTEILATQHYQTFKKLFRPFNLKIGLLTGSKKLAREKTHHPSSSIIHHPFNIIIGTHALIYNKVQFKKTGLVVIDEQHRFGVAQRAKLIKKGRTPHILTMTATPIPRTVALTLYGDLDLSILDEMPKGRKVVKTWVIPEEKRKDAYNWIRGRVKEGEQVFLICPLIDPSESEKMINIKAATAEFEKLKKAVFPELRLLLLHGKLKPNEKEKILEKFKNKKADILVSTPVVEVGIDITNATIMVIEAAERFGLSQLHQLRGRVGRGDKQSFCLLFNSQKQETKRLEAMEKYQEGLKLAEIDLKLRGPGELYGTAQSGFLNLKIASFYDKGLIKKARVAAEEILSSINNLPLLKNKLEKDTIQDIKPN